MGRKFTEELNTENNTLIETVAEIESMDIERELRAEELKREQIDTDLKREVLENSKQDRNARKNYALMIFGFLVCFMTSVMVVVFLSGNKNKCFELDESVLIALLTTSTANVIGVFVFVVKYLFLFPDEHHYWTFPLVFFP